MNRCQPKIPQGKVRRHQTGASLIFVMMILTIVSLLGVAGIQLSSLAERGARNDRDIQIAWQSAEAALVDAEAEMYVQTSPSPRVAVFSAANDASGFLPGCGSTGNNLGLCALVNTGKPAWLTVDFTNPSTSPSTPFGQFTGRTFAFGTAGAQPSMKPRYVIEPIRDPGDRDMGNANPKLIYRVTAMGFGPRPEIQSVVQMLYRP